jgi:hypothetical protein
MWSPALRKRLPGDPPGSAVCGFARAGQFVAASQLARSLSREPDGAEIAAELIEQLPLE